MIVQSNRVTIIVEDGAVYLDKWVYINIDLSMCNIPNNIHALQWLNGKGHIEYIGHTMPNLDINELPDWAIKCVEQWEIESKINPPLE